MVPTPVHSPDAEARGANRSSLYLSATLHDETSDSSAVKIRNLSSSGALVEGFPHASVGSDIQLVRGALAVQAVVVWSAKGRCGLKFSSRIDVARWRAAPTNAEQQRVDDIVRLVKAGAVPLPVGRASAINDFQSGTDSDAALVRELRRAKQLLARLGDVLTKDSNVLRLHGTSLQNLDIAMQAIAGVEDVISRRADREIQAANISPLHPSADQQLHQ